RAGVGREQPHGRRVPRPRRHGAADPVDRIVLRRGGGVGGDHDLDLVPAPDEEPGHLGRVRGRASHVGRPDAGHDEDLHGATASGGCSDPRSRRSTTVHRAQKTAVDASIAPAAPVAPQWEANTRSNGTKTAISTLWTITRRPGRPIDTGNDFVQPHTRRSAAATRTSRAASLAWARKSGP